METKSHTIMQSRVLYTNVTMKLCFHYTVTGSESVLNSSPPQLNLHEYKNWHDKVSYFISTVLLFWSF